MADEPSFLELQQLKAAAERMRDEAAALNAEADRKLAVAQRALGDADHHHRALADLERSVAAREAKLIELGEGKLLEREKIANEKLQQAEELIASVDKERRAAAINLSHLIEHDKRELAAMGIEY
jgi:hypothetical protein